MPSVNWDLLSWEASPAALCLLFLIQILSYIIPSIIIPNSHNWLIFFISLRKLSNFSTNCLLVVLYWRTWTFHTTFFSGMQYSSKHYNTFAKSFLSASWRLNVLYNSIPTSPTIFSNIATLTLSGFLTLPNVFRSILKLCLNLPQFSFISV